MITEPENMFLIVFVVLASAIEYCSTVPAMRMDDDELKPHPRQNEVEPENGTYPFPFVTRAEWNARTPKDTTPLTTPVPYVVIHHSYIPEACYCRKDCEQAMRSMQNFHMDDRGWWDVGYNFGVGSDGAAYEGRGWHTLGAHSKNFNRVSIGICLIGNWTGSVPPSKQLNTTLSLISLGISQGYIQPEYKLVGHRQVRDTECPGDALFNVIKKWEHFSDYPGTEKESLLLLESLKSN